MTQTDATAAPAEMPVVDDSTELVAEPDAGYRWKHLIMSILLIAGGLWFAYDGWIKWPKQNAQIEQVQRDKVTAQDAGDNARVEELSRQLSSMSHHTETDILIQKLLAFTLPAFGLFWGVWTLRDTRGLYRMTGDKLQAPGHPAITYADIRRIDKRKWDRKGIAFLHYDHQGRAGVLKLDDFAYERKATDAMLERIERNVLSTATAPAQS
jgi:hypothetical protein